jgi:hypothetical protein
MGFRPTQDFSIHHVRSISPAKDMFCFSFRLPPEVAYETVNPESRKRKSIEGDGQDGDEESDGREKREKKET